MKYNVITLAKFLSRYLGVQGKDVTNLTHNDVKELFPNLKRASFSYIEQNPKVLISGEVLLVRDNEKTIPYVTPSYEFGECIRTADIEEDIEYQEPDYASMNAYELKQLLNVRFNGYHKSRLARRELEDRQIVLNKKYNREEFKKWRNDYERD